MTDSGARTVEDEARASRGLKVFISYSRDDLDIVEQLAPALEALGYTVVIDRKGIHGAELWEKRLGQMILEASSCRGAFGRGAVGSSWPPLRHRDGQADQDHCRQLRSQSYRGEVQQRRDLVHRPRQGWEWCRSAGKWPYGKGDIDKAAD